VAVFTDESTDPLLLSGDGLPRDYHAMQAAALRWPGSDRDVIANQLPSLGLGRIGGQIQMALAGGHD
jgi:hypothetical protein